MRDRGGPLRIVRIACAVALAAGCTTYRVQQSTIVPAMALPPVPTNRGLADLYLGDSSLTFLSEPTRAPDSHAGLWVARHNLEFAGTLHVNQYIAFRALGVDALDEGAIRTAPTTLRKPHANATVFGLGVVAGLPIGERHRLYVEFDVLLVDVPSHVVATCESGCEDVPDTQVSDQYNILVLPMLTLDYGFVVAPKLTLIAALGARAQPTNQESFSSGDPVAEVHVGPTYVVVGVGAEIDVLKWLALVPRVQWPMMRDPIRYGPLVGFGVRGTFEPPTSAPGLTTPHKTHL